MCEGFISQNTILASYTFSWCLSILTRDNSGTHWPFHFVTEKRRSGELFCRESQWRICHRDRIFAVKRYFRSFSWQRFRCLAIALYVSPWLDQYYVLKLFFDPLYVAYLNILLCFKQRSFELFSFNPLRSWHSDTQDWASECSDVKNYKWRLNPVWHRMLFSCIHMTTVVVKG